MRQGGVFSMVLIAMGLPTYDVIGKLILSIYPYTTDKEMDHAVQVIAEEVRRQLMSVSSW